MVTSEAAFLFAPGASAQRPGLKQLVQRIAETMTGILGSFLILEVWAADDHAEVDETTGEDRLPKAAFRVMTRRPHRPDGMAATMEYALQQIRVHRKSPDVCIQMGRDNHPPGMKALMSERVEQRIGCFVLGFEVRPIYRDPETGEVFDRVARMFGRQVSHVIKKTVFSFAMDRTNLRPEHYFTFGSSKLSKQVLAVDRQLAELSRQFKFLLLVTPINAERARISFFESGYRKAPIFHYRPLNVDPLLLKRKLMRIGTERIDDPTLSYVLRQTQYELDRQITMLSDIGTFRFLPGSIQVFGAVKPTLRKLAAKVLRTLSSQTRSDEQTNLLTAHGFKRLAEKEVTYYRNQSEQFTATVSTRDDMYSGLLVAGGELLIGRQSRISRTRANALLQHEVGTHLVTYFNGAAQPLKLLQVGLADYDSLQEGMAVLSEFLVGGLTAGRLRTLAARVIAADEVTQGNSFPNVFQMLVDEYKFEPRTAYTITLRVFRGGGLTKDALYLRGLVEILEYLGEGGDIEPLILGKFAVEHVPIIRELTLAGVLRPALLRPKYLDSQRSQQRLKTIHPKTTVLDLIQS